MLPLLVNTKNEYKKKHEEWINKHKPSQDALRSRYNFTSKDTGKGGSVSLISPPDQNRT